MFDLEDENPSPGYWPSVSDLFITLFIIAIAILAVVFFALLPKSSASSDEAIIVAVGPNLENVMHPMNALRETLGLELIRPTQTPNEKVLAVDETCSKASERILALEADIKKLSELDAAREELVKLQEENRALKASLQKLEEDMERLRKILPTFEAVDIEAVIATNQRLQKENEELKKRVFIQFSEQDNEDYKFGSGSSSMGRKFIEGLRSNEFERLAKEIVARQGEGRVKVDTLEIIGHTDGQPFSGGGNLDQGLPDVLGGNRRISSLSPGSNNDLGLLRALAVREQWEAFISNHEHEDTLRSIDIRCYSAGQTILPEQKAQPQAADFRQDDKSARRIEMRLTRLKADDDLSSPEWEFEEEGE
ncbi:MAG: hypothetical protein ACQKBU_11865 [Verrucomicrobiales bacterium]